LLKKAARFLVQELLANSATDQGLERGWPLVEICGKHPIS
jgi:hypothetical protein